MCTYIILNEIWQNSYPSRYRQCLSSKAYRVSQEFTLRLPCPPFAIQAPWCTSGNHLLTSSHLPPFLRQPFLKAGPDATFAHSCWQAMSVHHCYMNFKRTGASCETKRNTRFDNNICTSQFNNAELRRLIGDLFTLLNAWCWNNLRNRVEVTQLMPHPA